MNFKKIGATVGSVALLVVGLSLVTATTASAHTPNASLTCIAASVSLVSYDQGATADITLDGASEHAGTFGGHLVQTYPTILSSSSTHTLVVHVVSQDGVKYNYDKTLTATGCDVVLIPVTVAEASSNPATCDSPATYTLPAQPEGIKYALQSDGTRLAAGTFTLEPGVSITVIAHSIAGYVPASESWTFTGAAKLSGDGCVTSTPTATPTAPPTALSTNTPKKQVLAFTGDSTRYVVVGSIAAGLLFVGFIFLLIKRRTSRS